MKSAMEDIFSTRCELSKYKFMYSVSQCCGGDKCEHIAGSRLAVPAHQGITSLVIDNIDAL